MGGCMQCLMDDDADMSQWWVDVWEWVHWTTRGCCWFDYSFITDQRTKLLNEIMTNGGGIHEYIYMYEYVSLYLINEGSIQWYPCTSPHGNETAFTGWK